METGLLGEDKRDDGLPGGDGASALGDVPGSAQLVVAFDADDVTEPTATVWSRDKNGFRRSRRSTSAGALLVTHANRVRPHHLGWRRMRRPALNGDDGVGMHWHDWHLGGWMGLWWIVVVIAAVVAILLLFNSSRRADDRRESPERALKRRYANGEIDRETYGRMLDDLRK